ncbi:MAG: aspartate aminotransferase family protein [Calditrichia bacterium]
MKHVLWCIGHDLLLPEIERGEGCYVYDRDGRKYLDLESGVWCTPLGHNHPEVNRALKAQAERLMHMGYCYSGRIVEEAAADLLDISGLSDGKAVFLSSGSEAVEFGVQAIREITGKPLVLTLSESFLGSYGSAGSKRPEEWHLFDRSVCLTCERISVCDPQCPHLTGIPFGRIGGFVFEPGSSSGLVRFPPRPLIQNLVKLVCRHGGIIQINEITTGMGRTGRWFGYQHYGIRPDIISLGKGLGNGYPVSAILLTRKISTRLRRISFHYSQSHQNDPLGCAVVQAVVSVMKAGKIVEKSRRMGKYFQEKLLQLKEKYPIIREVRGRGLIVVVEFQETLPAGLIDDWHRQLIGKGFIVARRPGVNAFRMDPPLIITKEEIDSFLTAFGDVMNSAV